MELWLALNMTWKWFLFSLMTFYVLSCASKFLFFAFIGDLKWPLIYKSRPFRDLGLNEVLQFMP